MKDPSSSRGEPEKDKGPGLREQAKPLAKEFASGGARAVGYQVVKTLLELAGLK